MRTDRARAKKKAAAKWQARTYLLRDWCGVIGCWCCLNVYLLELFVRVLLLQRMLR
jgi:hypothetical protein